MFRGSTVACTLSDFFEGCGGNCVDGVARSEVRLDLLLAPSSFKQCYQVGGADYVLSQTAQQFNSPAIDQRNGEDDVVGRILHGDITAGCEHRLQSVEQLLPSGILSLAAGQGIKVASFDLVDQLYRLALRWNQIKPAPRDHQPRGQAEYAIGDGVTMMMVVKQPRV